MKTAIKPPTLSSSKVYYPSFSINSKTPPAVKVGSKIESGFEGILRSVGKNDDGTYRCEVEVRDIAWEGSKEEKSESKPKSKSQKDKMSEMGY